MSAVRNLIYGTGPWNGWRPFEYDHAHFKAIPTKLLADYLAMRRGNCVSMPILFLILGDRVGLDVALARAPSHLFVRYHDPDGPITNLETTSGAQPARDIWLRETLNVSQRGIDTGLYMRSLTRREGVGAMALTVVEHLMEQGHNREAITVAEVIHRNDPTDAYSLGHIGNACRRIVWSESPDHFCGHWLSSLPAQMHSRRLLERGQAASRAARELGWEPVAPRIQPNG